MRKTLLILGLCVGLSLSSFHTVMAYYLSDAVMCEDVDDEDYRPINITSKEWEIGSSPHFYVNIGEVGVDHKFKYAVERNGDRISTSTEDEWRNVGEWPWSSSSFYGCLEDAPRGEYQVTFYLDTGDGFEELSQIEFLVGTEEQREKEYFIEKTVVCEDIDEGDYQPINITSKEWEIGASPHFYVNLREVDVDHKFKYKIERNGVKISTFAEYEWRNVGKWPWSNSSFYGRLEDVPRGEYQVTFYLDTGEGFKELSKIKFLVGTEEEEKKVNMAPIINLLLND